MSNDYENDQIMQMDEMEEDTTKDLYLSFLVESEEYAIDVASAKEIVPMSRITITPEQPRYVKGIINLRGDIIPVIEVRTRFEKPDKEYDENTCIIIIYHDDYIMGLIVDKVIGVYTIHEEDIAAPPSAKLNHSNLYVKNIGKASDGLKLLLDLDKLLG